MERCKAILWDVYGTLIASPRGDLESQFERGRELTVAFQKVITQFQLGEALQRFDPGHDPSETLRTLYLQRIQAIHREKQANGIAHPEVRIELVWAHLFDLLAVRGPSNTERGVSSPDFFRDAALCFERAANPKRLYPGVCEALLGLRRRTMRQGILSNAQFYTRIDLDELLRGQSDGAIPDARSVFEERLMFLSCDFGFSKPDPGMFQRARQVLAAEGIPPEQCLCVGNDMLNDVWCAKQSGFVGALFAGDPDSVRWRRDDPRCADLKPDAVFQNHGEILQFL